MLWKKGSAKESAGDTAKAESAALSAWEAFVEEAFHFYSRSRQEFCRVERWDVETLFKTFALDKQADGGYGDLKAQLNKLQQSFFNARRKEVSAGRQQLADIRSLLWSSLDQICTLVSAQEKEARVIRETRQILQLALQQDDMNLARKKIQEVLSTLVSLDKSKNQSLEELQRHFQGQVASLESELQMAQKELQLDGLTQVYNRATFDQQLKKVSQFAFLTGEVNSLIMFDIDHFKKVNDSYGHSAGDRVIQAFAKALVQSFPRRTDFVARYGGEEFAVILQGTGEAPARELLAKCLVKVRGLRIPHGDLQLAFTSSAGLASYEKGESPERWLERADKALYEAKQSGRDRFIIASPKIARERESA